jgi:two-component system CheB/CheR fusion protein
MTFANEQYALDGEALSVPVRTVGIGASAGGLGACKELFSALSPDTGMAFVVVLHLDPTHTSHLGELLSKSTTMPVIEVSSDQKLLANHVYVIVPDTSLDFRDGTLYPSKLENRKGVRKPIDALFEGLARDQRERAIGVVLSGSADDGSAGLRQIDRVGGICLAQDPESAEFDGMPRSAVATGVVDQVLRPAAIAAALVDVVGDQREAVETPVSSASQQPKSSEQRFGQPKSSEQRFGQQIDPDSKAFEQILGLVNRRHGLDFEQYRIGTLGRRISRRIGLSQASDVDAYVGLLRDDRAEIDELYQDLLIDVTHFFRDPKLWEFLAQEVIPKIVEANDGGAPLRFWVAACASGEEAYSLAMIVLEALDAAGRSDDVQIFATDVNPKALEVGRRGLYASTIAEDVSEARLKRYFIEHGEHFQVNGRVCEMVTFAVHDLLSAPPFSRMNLVSCRNLLIYLEPNAQQHAIDLMRYALNPGGFLVLGSSESIGQRNQHFKVVSKSLRVYEAEANGHHKTRSVTRWLPGRANDSDVSALRPPRAPRSAGADLERNLERYILKAHTPAAVAVNSEMDILHFYGVTEDYLSAPTGAAELDLLTWVRPGLYAGLQPALKQAIDTGEEVESEEMFVERDNQSLRVICRVEPLDSLPGGEGAFLVTFHRPAGEAPKIGEASEEERSLVKRLEIQLRTGRREQRQLVDRLEDTREAYQTHHEELLSLNEELQSTNEELETSKEELQSLNEEMLTVNRELEEKNRELRDLNTDLNNLLVSTDIPTVFLNKDLEVRRFTPTSTQVMRLVPSDIGRSIEHIKERFVDADIVATAKHVMETGDSEQAEICTDKGRFFLQQVMPYRTDYGEIDGVTVTYTDITEQRNRAAEIQEARQYSEAIVRTIRTPLLVLDADLTVVSTNEAFCKTFQTSEDEMLGERLFEAGDGRWDIPGLRDLLEKVLPERLEVDDFSIEHNFKRLGTRFLRLNASSMDRPDNAALILLSIEDVTARTVAELEAQLHAAQLAAEHDLKDQFLATLGHELRNPMAALSYGLEYLDGVGDDEHVQKTQHMMERQLTRMKNMLDQLLETSRLASGKIRLEAQPVDMADAVGHALEAVRPRVESHHHELITSLPPAGEAVVVGDTDRLAQVVENLLTNAIKYTDEGGRIEVTVDAVDDEVVVKVRDSGVGIEPDLLPQVFELFSQAPQTLERSAGGLGLGLALARSLVDLHHGQLAAYSDGLGAGSEFVITLPRVGRNAPQGQVSTAEDSRSEHSRRILLIDDESDSTEIFAMILQAEGHEVRVANDGASALEVVSSFQPEVIFLDLGLSGSTGYEVARQIRDEVGDAPIIVALTGYQRDSEKLDNAGINRHVIKPPDLPELTEWIASLS